MKLAKLRQGFEICGTIAAPPDACFRRFEASNLRRVRARLVHAAEIPARGLLVMPVAIADRAVRANRAYAAERKLDKRTGDTDPL